jgi:hypothetical protein
MTKGLEAINTNELPPIIEMGISGTRKSIAALGTVLSVIVTAGGEILPEVARQGTKVSGDTIKALLRTIRAPIDIILGDRKEIK